MSSRSRVRERREQEARRRRFYWIGGIAVVAIIVAVIIALPNLRGQAEIVDPASFDWPTSEGATMGDPNAPVTITEYSDFQCPYCRQFHEGTLRQIVDNHVRTGEVRFEYNSFPFIGRESVEAANAAMCAADQGQFFTYADYLFANQTGENVGAFTESRLQAIAQAIGLDMDTFEQCSSQNAHQDEVQAQYAAGLDAGVNSTPTFFVNGKLVNGALPYAQFKDEIETALSSAQ
ncbi:MAG: thioredoxin domain-containing protein [Anaerolineales bacterium]